MFVLLKLLLVVVALGFACHVTEKLEAPFGLERRRSLSPIISVKSSASCLHARMFQHQLDGVIQVFGLEHEDPAQLLLRLGIWAIGDRHFDILPLQGGGVLSALERFPNHQSNLSLEARRRRQNTHPSWHSARFRTWFPIFSNPCIQSRCISQVPPVWMVQQFVDCSLCL